MKRLALCALSVWLFASCGAAQEPLVLGFEGDPAAPEVAPLQADGAVLVTVEQGHAYEIGPGARLCYAPPAFLTEGFDITLRVRHQHSMADLHYQELVYLYHETANERNRICLQKRGGTDYILFSMSDGTGKAKGAAFSGNWFALKSPALDWAAETWHDIRITASRQRGEAALYVDGRRVAFAQGTQLPREVGERLWLGSLAGRSPMLGWLDNVTIAPMREDGQ